MASLQSRLSSLIAKIKGDFDAAKLRITTLENAGGGIGESFETTLKNLGAHPFVLSRTGDVLDSITYITPAGDTVKSFTYINGVLVSITLSGVLPVGVKTVKTLTYSAGVLTGAIYS